MIKKIAVIGAGTMGHSIAENFATFGFEVSLFDTNADYLKKVKDIMKAELDLLDEAGLIEGQSVAMILDRIALFSDLERCAHDADYVIEAIPERIDMKLDLFEKLDHICGPDTIFASNTSSLKLDDMMASVSEERKKRMMICHWYNPALIMPIAELSYFGNMPAEIYSEVETLYEAIGKQVVKVLKEVPGLVANRIQQGVAREVFSLIQMGVASPEDIDKALIFGPGFRYATTGQLEIADLGGLDIWCTVGDNLLSEMDNSTKANPILREKVEKNELGFKTQKGFFDYPEEKAEGVKAAYTRRLLHQLKASKYYIKK
ncbi:MAG: 3-hydroxybutyryl-CoA dehydrogenase [Clostridiales bacterium]|nr:3-hydroxybutyryl-CoA dehydrogenase [Clostridiales bacterium]